MQNSSEENAVLLENALLLSRDCAEIVLLIDESMILLAQKRRTLEEKAIIAYFHGMAALYGSILVFLHECMSGPAADVSVLANELNRLRTVNENIRNSIQELLKILKYNLNFLEQYFEYDYCSKLLNESKFKEELSGVLDGFRA